jgi:hypothetical protein
MVKAHEHFGRSTLVISHAKLLLATSREPSPIFPFTTALCRTADHCPTHNIYYIEMQSCSIDMYTQLGHTSTNILGGTHFHENKAVGQIMTKKLEK